MSSPTTVLSTSASRSITSTIANSTAQSPFTPASSSSLSPSQTGGSTGGGRGSNCDINFFLTIPNIWPSCAMQTGGNISVVPILTDCCRGAPQVLYNSNCHIYCEARNQTLEQLHDCFNAGLRSRQGSIGSLPILCNRGGASYSSLLPANTADPAMRSSSVANAAARNVVGGAMVRRDAALLSAGAWATVFVLALSGVAGLIT